MKLTKARIDGFKYEGRAIDKGGMSRDVRWDDAEKGLGLRIYRRYTNAQKAR